MKIVFTAALLFIGFTMFGQSTQTKSTTQNSTVSTTGSSTTNPKANSLCKTWYLSQTENFGDVHKPTDQQKGDLLLLMDGGRYRIIMNGVAEGGTWSLSKDNLWISFTSDSSVVKKFKIIESTDKGLKVDYRDADEVHNILYYSIDAPTQTKVK